MSDIGQFLEAFNDVESNLRIRAQDPNREITFLALLKHLERHPVIRRYKKDLRQLAELRNLLVHHSGPKLADPTRIAMEKVHKIHELLTRPPTVLEISSKPLAQCTDDTPIHDVLRYMQERDYTQLPVMHKEEGKDDALIGILSSESIRRWITARSEPNGFIVLDKLVQEIIPFLDVLTAKDLLPRNAEAFVIEERFSQDTRHRIHALFVTENGRTGECLLGVITPHDLTKIQQYFLNGDKV